MNYLALGALHKVRAPDCHIRAFDDPIHQTYAAREGPYQAEAKEIYAELRKNVVNNVVKVNFHGL
jgi:hypothetical protein